MLMKRTPQSVRTSESPCPSPSSASPATKAFYCTLPTSADGTVIRFPVSDGTSLDTVASTIYKSLAFTGVARLPPLTFKLSTDPEDAPWNHLDSPDDWDYAISRVRNKK